MLKKLFLAVVCLVSISALFADIAPAEVKYDYGAAFRLRYESWENVADLGTVGAPSRDFFRFRSNLWGKTDLNQDLSFNLGLTNEAKYYIGSYKPFETNNPATTDTDRFDPDELVIDNLYMTYKNVGGIPIDLRIGRQNFLFTFGEMFLIADGTPGDGSRTYYFNAVRATVKFNERNNVDIVYISDPETDEYLPSWHSSYSKDLVLYVNNKRLLNASDEQGVVVYGRSKLSDNLTIEPYYIWKFEDQFTTPYGLTPKLDINTIGMRAVVTYDEWKLRAEYAHQFGEYSSGRDRDADGGYLFFGRKHSTVPMKPEWELGYIYMSGDDPNTAKHEGWDPLFSRAPAWNEISIYPMVYENMRDSGPIPAYWTNLIIYLAGVKMDLAPATNLGVSYQYLRAAEATKGLNANMFSNSGKDRGQVGTLMLKQQFTKRLDGYVQVECFFPGNFYNEQRSETAWFTRLELQYKF